jgi:hypothetical protein
MKYNIEKISLIAKQSAEIVEEAMEENGKEGILIGDVEMTMRESLREEGQSVNIFWRMQIMMLFGLVIIIPEK